jgi:hypothetical protein
MAKKISYETDIVVSFDVRVHGSVRKTRDGMEASVSYVATHDGEEIQHLLSDNSIALLEEELLATFEAGEAEEAGDEH